MRTQTECTILNAKGGVSLMLDSAPLKEQSKLLKFQIHNPVRATVVPITHDKLQIVDWSIYNGQIVQSSSKLIILLQTLLSVILIDVLV